MEEVLKKQRQKKMLEPKSKRHWKNSEGQRTEARKEKKERRVRQREDGEGRKTFLI